MSKVTNSGQRGGTGDRSLSYPFFSGYERDEAFPQDTDLSPYRTKENHRDRYLWPSAKLSTVSVNEGKKRLERDKGTDTVEP